MDNRNLHQANDADSGPQPLKIGYQSKLYGSSHPATKAHKLQQKLHYQQRAHVPKEWVDIYNGRLGEYVGKIELKQLVRFSRAAANQFPKPQQAKVATSNAARAPASTELTGEPAVQQQIHTAMASLGLSDKVVYDARPGAQPAESSATSSTTPARTTAASTASTTPTSNKTFTVTLRAPQGPTSNAVIGILTWMKLNATVHGNAPLSALAGPNLTTIPLVDLIDMYQASLAFALRPHPTALRDELVTRLTSTAPSPETLALVYENLPVGDALVTEALDAHCAFYYAGAYDAADVQAIEAYLGAHEALARKLAWVERLRRGRSEQQRLAEGGRVMQGGFEGLGGKGGEAVKGREKKKGAAGKGKSGKGGKGKPAATAAK